MNRRTRQYSALDQLLGRTHKLLNTLAPHTPGTDRPNPVAHIPQPPLKESERRHVAGLMRVNHSGEICAQGLYEGQALTARLPRIRPQMAQSAQEEQDHLAWCEQRLTELQSQPSLFNPLWYSLSFTLGAAAGKAGDAWSLGFVEETEYQVCRHLQKHMDRLPLEDQRTRAILQQMHDDEAQHALKAKQAGAPRLPPAIRKLMALVSKVMTITAYRL